MLLDRDGGFAFGEVLQNHNHEVQAMQRKLREGLAELMAWAAMQGCGEVRRSS